MGFGQALSGVNAASQNLDVIGNNIANASTVGYKAGSMAFADIYASSRIGLGVQVSDVKQRFTTGNLEVTGNQYDMAIDGNAGFFRLINTNGEIVYSRNGQFLKDKENYIVNAQGMRLTGYPPNIINPDGSVISGVGQTPIELVVPAGNVPPQATTTIDFERNLNSGAPAISGADVAETLGVLDLADFGAGTFSFRVNNGQYEWVDGNGDPLDPAAVPDGTYTSTTDQTVTLTFTNGQPVGDVSAVVTTAYVPAVAGRPFDPTVPASYTNSVPMTVYDSLGNAHVLTQYYVKRPSEEGVTSSNWDVYYVLDNEVLTENVLADPDDPDSGVEQPLAHRLTFNSSGVLTEGERIDLSFNGIIVAGSPADPLNIVLNYDGTTQFGSPFTQNFTQNGYSSGEFVSIAVGTSGDVIASYTNGQTRNIGTLVLANFNNVTGLKAIGGNAWSESPESGQAILGQPGSNGLATIKGQAIESSNVDMSQELVNMIIAQRTYQANAQTIKTQDQILQTLISMR